MSAARCLAGVQLRVMAEYAFVVEREPPRRIEIGCDARLRRNLRGERMKQGITAALLRHRVRECIRQSAHDLEQRKIDVGEPGADRPAAAARIESQHALEITKKFRHAL